MPDPSPPPTLPTSRFRLPVARRDPDGRVILGAPERGACMSPASTSNRDEHPAVDVPGPALGLRELDLETFLHPRSVAVIGASEASRKPNTAMTRRVKEWADEH